VCTKITHAGGDTDTRGEFHRHGILCATFRCVLWRWLVEWLVLLRVIGMMNLFELVICKVRGESIFDLLILSCMFHFGPVHTF
jgi:hypothetical protein